MVDEKKGILDYLNPLEGWKEGWWDPLRGAGSSLYDLDAAILGDEEARKAAEGIAGTFKPGPTMSPEDVEKFIGPPDDPYGLYWWPHQGPEGGIPPDTEYARPEESGIPSIPVPTPTPTKPGTGRPVVRGKRAPTGRAYIDVPGPAFREPPLGPAPSKEGWPREAYGIAPKPSEEKVSFLRKLLTGKGTLTGMPYILPILAALSEGGQGGRFLQMWAGMRGRKLAVKEADLARLQHVYDLKMKGLARGIPLGLGDRKRLAAIDPSLLRKHLVSKEVTYRYNRKAKKWMTEDEIAEKNIEISDLGEPITRVEKNYDWLVKPEGPEYQAIRTEKASLAARQYRAKIMDKEFEEAYGRDYVKSDKYKRIRADYVAQEVFPGAKWITVDGGQALLDPKTNTILSSYIDPGMTVEAKLKLRTKYQKQLIDYTVGAEKPQTVAEALELMTRIKRSINLDYNGRLTALANRAQAAMTDPDLTDEQRQEMQREMKALMQEQRDILAALDREFSKNPLLTDFFKGKKIRAPLTGETDVLFTSQLEQAAKARAGE